LRRLRAQFPEELVVIGVHSAKFPTEKMTENIYHAVKRHGIEHPVVNDAGFKIWNSYAVRAWPTLVLIDPNGRIAGEVSGEILAEDFAQNILEVIEQNQEILIRAPLDRTGPVPQEPVQPLRYPSRVLLSDETLYIADTGHHRILEVHLDENGIGGELVRVIGAGQPAFKDGPAGTAAFHSPHGLGLQGSPGSGTLFVADTENHAVRAVDLESGEVRTLAGTGKKAHGRPEVTEPGEIPLRSPWAVLPVDTLLLVAMAGSHQVWVITQNGEGALERLGPFAGNGNEALVDGPVGQSSFNQPSDLALGMGHLFVADPEASAVRAISLHENPQTVTLIGQGLFDFGDQDGPTDSALLQHPVGLDFYDGKIYLADTYNNKIKVLDPAAGHVETLIGSGRPELQDGPFLSASLHEPEGLRVHRGRLYIADTNNHQVRVADLTSWQMHTFRMRGLERLPAGEAAQVEETVLSPVSAASGTLRLKLEVQMPAGYVRNPDAPLMVRTGGSQPAVYSFAPAEEILIVEQLQTTRDLSLEVVIYYCQEEKHQVCLIHHGRLRVPLVAAPGGPTEAVIRYTLPDVEDLAARL
jgi:hypothetical protein